MAFKINNRRYTGSKYKISEWIRTLILENCKDCKSFCDIFVKPYLFTPQKANSTALSVTAGLLLCGNRNGWEYWKDQNGIALNDDKEPVKKIKKK